jgi:hypothetical protein
VLSIVIPTRNRLVCARSTIHSLVSIPDPGLDLVIQDNGDSDELGVYLRDNVPDSRVRYHWSPQPLSFVGNFEAAVARAEGTYVCVIGDDDTVNAEIMHAARWAAVRDLDAMIFRPLCAYLWPNAGVGPGDAAVSTSGVLTIQDFSGRTRFANVEAEIRRLLDDGGLYYLDRDLPKLYHGLVNRRCIDAVYRTAGAYFGGLSPDTYISLALSCVAKTVIVVDYPLTIHGASRTSGAIVEGALKQHSRRLEDAPHLQHRGPYEWNELIPRLYAVETLWVESSLAALRDMKRADLAATINLPRFAARCIASNPDVFVEVHRHVVRTLRRRGSNHPFAEWRFELALTKSRLESLGRFARRIWTRILITIGHPPFWQLQGVPDTVTAAASLERYLLSRNNRVSNVLQ